MLGAIIPILSSVIGVVAKGKAAKAIAGGAGGVILTAGGPVLEMLQNGFVQGLGPSVEQLGVAVGQAVGGFVVGYLITWIAPANKEA